MCGLVIACGDNTQEISAPLQTTKTVKKTKKKRGTEGKQGQRGSSGVGLEDEIAHQIKPAETRNPFRRVDEKRKKIQDLVDQSQTGKDLANLTDFDARYHLTALSLGKKTTDPRVGNVNLDAKIEPKVTGGRAQVSGKLDRETVRKVIRRNLSGIRQCYQTSLQRDKGLKGRLNLAFEITPNGTVTGITMTGMEGDVALTACVKRRMAIWRFPAPKSSGVIKVKYPVFLKTRTANR